MSTFTHTMTPQQVDAFLAPTMPRTPGQHPGSTLHAIVGSDTFDAITDRCKRLLAHGHPVTIVTQLGDGDLKVIPVATPHLHSRTARSGTNWSETRGKPDLMWSAYYMEPNGSTYDAMFGFRADADRTARDNADRARRQAGQDGMPRDVTRVTIHGGGTDIAFRDDQITVEDFNEHGVRTLTVVTFHRDTPTS